MKKHNEEITLKELFDIFLPKIWIIALVAVVFAAILGSYSMFVKKDTYTSTASFIMVKIPTQYDSGNNNQAITTGLSASEIEAMQSMIGMAEQVMETSDYLGRVKDELVKQNPEYESVTIGQLKKMLSIKIIGDATVFDLSAVTEDPELSYAVTNIVYFTLPEVIEDVFEYYSITIKLIDPPVKASSPNDKNIIRNAFIGGLAGALLALVAVFVAFKLDVIIRSKGKIEHSFNVPLIGIIPRFEDNNE